MAYGLESATTWRTISCPPILILSPLESSRSPAIFAPFTSTPFRLPRSPIANPSRRTLSTAWRRDTSGSSSESWHSGTPPHHELAEREFEIVGQIAKSKSHPFLKSRSPTLETFNPLLNEALRWTEPRSGFSKLCDVRPKHGLVRMLHVPHHRVKLVDEVRGHDEPLRSKEAEHKVDSLTHHPTLLLQPEWPAPPLGRRSRPRRHHAQRPEAPP